MGIAKWAGQSFKKSDRKKYADGGAVDLSSSSYADNSGGTWGDMGSRALSQARDDTATADINRATAPSVTPYDDQGGDAMTDSFKSEPTGQDDATAKKIEDATPAKPYDDKPISVGGVTAAKARSTKLKDTEDQVSRAAPREAKREAEGEDQVKRRAEREKRAERMKKFEAVAAPVRGAGSGTAYKHKMLPVVDNEMPGSQMLRDAGAKKLRSFDEKD